MTESLQTATGSLVTDRDLELLHRTARADFLRETVSWLTGHLL